jgi:hypothetical protein
LNISATIKGLRFNRMSPSRSALIRPNYPTRSNATAAMFDRARTVVTLERRGRDGTPTDLGELFNLRTGRNAICRVRSHQAGWELELAVGSELEVVLKQVCHNQDEVLTTAQAWQAQLIAIKWV